MNAVEFNSFTVRHGGEFALHDLNFHIPSGYITGLIGPNGSGKTTLIRSIMNLIRPEHGEVLVFGQSYRDRERAIKRKIGFVYDEDYFYNHLSMKQMKTIIASFYPDWNETAFRRYCDDFQLPVRRLIRDLSKGMKTKFALAAALAHEPELLIMDEPTSGLDPVFRRDVLSILSAYIQDEKRSVLFSTHISADLERIADYIVHVQRGRLQYYGSKDALLDSYLLVKGPAEWLQASQHKNCFAGLQQHALGFEGLLPADRYDEDRFGYPLTAERPTLDDILFYAQEGK